jgi:hypothetical protein
MFEWQTPPEIGFPVLMSLGGSANCNAAVAWASFTPPMLLFPRYVEASQIPWQYAGSTVFLKVQNGAVSCKANVTYTNTLMGWETVSGQQALHFRTFQSLHRIQGSCPLDFTWQEDWWFGTSIPVEGGGTANGLLKTTGPGWNITFAQWRARP